MQFILRLHSYKLIGDTSSFGIRLSLLLLYYKYCLFILVLITVKLSKFYFGLEVKPFSHEEKWLNLKKWVGLLAPCQNPFKTPFSIILN